MTSTGAAKGPQGDPTARRRRIVLAAGAALIVLVLVGLALLLSGGGDDDPSPDAAGSARTTTPSSTADVTVPPPPPTPTPTGPTENVDQGPPSLPAVPLEASASVGNGIVASLPQIEAIQGSAVGPGNVSGPALRVTVRIQNGTAQPVSVDGVAVNMAYGPELTPASPLEDPSQRPFSGMVAPGGSTEGVYVFSVPSDARDSITVEVGYQAGAPLLIFTGSAP